MREFNDLRLLSIFVAVYQSKGISAGARVLNITQPSVTRSIQRLENEVGVPLFDRSSNGIVATEFAARLYRRALSIIDEIDSIHADAQRLADSKRHLISIGSGLGCWITVSDVLVKVYEQQPDLVFNVTITNARQMLSLVESGSLDVLVGNTEILNSVPWLESEVIYDIENYFVARKNHPVFEYDLPTQAERILQFPSVTYHTLEHSHRTQMSGSARVRANDYLFLLKLVNATDMYLKVGKDMLKMIESFDLRVVGDKPVGHSNYSVAYPKGKGSEDVYSIVSSLIKYRD